MQTKIHIPHHHQLHLWRFFWLFFLVGGLLAIQVAHNFQATQNFQVLAYSTNVNRGDLQRLSNNERAAHGLPGMQLNSALNQAAQGKAEHMIANNYWAHTAPDGTTPWYWLEWAGYNYLRAGENLAYGFADSAGVTKGWMNSPGHRANILGDYKEVGFGYANGANYQGGEYTVVVAMYGTVQGVAATAPPPSSTTAQPQAPAPPPAPTPSVPVEQPAPAAEPEPIPAAPIQVSPVAKPAPKEAAGNTNQIRETTVAHPAKVTTIEQALTGSAAWPLYASLAVIIISTAGFSMTHVKLMRYGWNNGLRFTAHHPIFDATVVASVALFFLTATVGYIR